MKAHGFKSRCRCFTLHEMLAVVTLLGLLAGFTVRGIFRHAASPTETLRKFASIDAESRLLARESGPLRLRTEPDSRRVIITANGSDKAYPLDHAIRLQADGSEISQIRFTRHGQSQDYSIEVQGAATKTLNVAGLTGWTWTERKADAR